MAEQNHHGNYLLNSVKYLYFAQVKPALSSKATQRCGAVQPLPLS